MDTMDTLDMSADMATESLVSILQMEGIAEYAERYVYVYLDTVSAPYRIVIMDRWGYETDIDCGSLGEVKRELRKRHVRIRSGWRVLYAGDGPPPPRPWEGSNGIDLLINSACLAWNSLPGVVTDQSCQGKDTPTSPHHRPLAYITFAQMPDALAARITNVIRYFPSVRYIPFPPFQAGKLESRSIGDNAAFRREVLALARALAHMLRSDDRKGSNPDA